MFDIGMAEMAVVGVVALIVVGPKDLPMMFRKVGQFVGKARGMARDFNRAMDQAADETGVGEVSKTLKQAASMKNLGLDDAAKSFREAQKSLDTPKEPVKVDAAAQHAARVRMQEHVETAEKNKADADGEKADTTSKVEQKDKSASKKTAAVKNSPAKKAAAKKAPAKKPAAKKPAAKKPAVEKTPTAKPATKKPAAKKAASKSATSESETPKATTKKPAAKKAAAKKPAAKAPKADT